MPKATEWHKIRFIAPSKPEHILQYKQQITMSKYAANTYIAIYTNYY